jgi:sugar phosphate permease
VSASSFAPVFWLEHSAVSVLNNSFTSSQHLADRIQLLAYAIAKMSGIAGLGGWRWIFILEGLATVVMATSSYWLVPDWPETAAFLEPHEREMLLRRLAEDSAGAKMNRWDKQASKRVLGDVKIWLG